MTTKIKAKPTYWKPGPGRRFSSYILSDRTHERLRELSEQYRLKLGRIIEVAVETLDPDALRVPAEGGPRDHRAGRLAREVRKGEQP
jgi:hypothetical protein